MALLVMFATMDTLCSQPWPHYRTETVAPLGCEFWASDETEDCGPLCVASFWNDATVGDVLHELNISPDDIDRRNGRGYSPLHLAARCSADPDVITLLLVAGADPNRKGNEDARPLHIAAGNSDAAIVERLLDGGADVDARMDRSLTALHLAAWNDQAESVGLLIAAGADIERKDGLDHTPLQVAAWRGSLDTLVVLIDAGAELNKRGHGGWTALHHAVYDSALHELFETDPAAAGTLLLDRGADPYLRTSAGQTACDLIDDRSRGSALHAHLCMPAE